MRPQSCLHLTHTCIYMHNLNCTLMKQLIFILMLPVRPCNRISFLVIILNLNNIIYCSLSLKQCVLWIQLLIWLLCLGQLIFLNGTLRYIYSRHFLLFYFRIHLKLYQLEILVLIYYRFLLLLIYQIGKNNFHQ